MLDGGQVGPENYQPQLLLEWPQGQPHVTHAFIFDVDVYEADLKRVAKRAVAVAVLENRGRRQKPVLLHVSQRSQVATAATGNLRARRGGERDAQMQMLPVQTKADSETLLRLRPALLETTGRPAHAGLAFKGRAQMFWVLLIDLLRGSILTALRKVVTGFTKLGVWVWVVVLPPQHRAWIPRT